MPSPEAQATPGSSLRERVDAQADTLVPVAGRDFEVLMQLPAGASAERRKDRTIVRNGPEFVIEIQRGGAETATVRQQVVAEARSRLRGFLVDLPAALMYETDPTPDGKAGGFHIYVALADDRGRVTCRSSDDGTFTLEQAEAMLLACKSMVMPDR